MSKEPIELDLALDYIWSIKARIEAGSATQSEIIQHLDWTAKYIRIHQSKNKVK